MLYLELTFYVHQCAELDFGWIVVLPVDRCGPEHKVEKRAVEDFFDLVPLPSLRREGEFFWLRLHRRRSVGRKCPRGVRKAYERRPEHGEGEGRSAGDSVPAICLSANGQSKGS